MESRRLGLVTKVKYRGDPVLLVVREETYGTVMSSCSSASLASSGSALSLSAHVFLTMALPASRIDSLSVVISSKLICW